MLIPRCCLNGMKTAAGFPSCTVTEPSKETLLPENNITRKKKPRPRYKANKTKGEEKNQEHQIENATPSTYLSEKTNLPKSTITENPKKIQQNIRASYSNVVNKKAENILILTDSMLKTLRMREFNRLLKGKDTAHLKAFTVSKAKQLHHHSIPILEENAYDSAVIHVGINDLLKNPHETKDIAKIVQDITDVALNCRIYNVGTIFISGIVYCDKIDFDFICKLNKKLHEECLKNGFHFIDNYDVESKDLWNDGVHMVESGKSIVANNIIDNLKNFLGLRNHLIGN